ncbi:MAG: GntR family transcriptional regulator [Acidimicrobiales bacterium]
MRRPQTLDRDTTAKAVAERLRDEIQDGVLAPGARLRQNDIARRFGVSTTPVREAFAQLQAEGLLRIDPHRGAIVFHPSPDDLLEFYEIRGVLESFAVNRAVPRLTPETVRSLQLLIDRMRKTADARKWLRLNDDFHLKLYERAEMPRLVALIENLRDASTPYIHMFVAGRPPSQRADGEHQAILDACVKGDAEEAQHAILQHLSSAAQDLVRALGGSPEEEAEAEAMVAEASSSAE